MMVRTLGACSTTTCMACASTVCETTRHDPDRDAETGRGWIWDQPLINGRLKMTRKEQGGACAAVLLFWDNAPCR